MKHLSKKRVLACLMAALLTGSVLSGCGGEDKPKSGDITEDGKVVLKAMFNVANTMTMEFDEMPVIQQIEEETGVDVYWEIVRTGWEDQKQLVLASGDLPDMFFGDRTLGSSDIIANKALFTDLSEYLDQMPNVSAMFEEEPAMKNYVTTEEGSVYFLPSRMPLRPKTLTCVFINQTWLDNLGLSMPTTTDELVTVLEAFKNDDPNGNGVQDEIPMLGNGTGWNGNTLTALMGAFGITVNEYSSDNLMIQDGQLQYVPTMDGYRECLTYLNQLFEAGLIDSESFTQDGSQHNAKLTQTDPQIVGIGAGWTITSLVGLDNADDYVELPPLKGPNGDQMWSSNPSALAVIQSTWSLSNDCPDKEAAIRFIDAIYDQEISAQLYFGPYGEGMEKQDDGTIQVLESPDPEMDYNTYLWTAGFGGMGPFYVGREFEENLIPNSWAEEKLQHDAVYEPYIPDESEIYPLIFLSEEDAAEMSVLATDINNIVNQKFSQWVSGEADIDAEWDSYLQSLEDVGLSRMMEIYNKYWEESKQ